MSEEILVGGPSPVDPATARCQLCSRCNHTVWLSPSLLEKLDQNPHTMVICFPCFVALAADDPDITVRIPGQKDMVRDGATPEEARGVHQWMRHLVTPTPVVGRKVLVTLRDGATHLAFRGGLYEHLESWYLVDGLKRLEDDEVVDWNPVKGTSHDS